MYQKNDLISSQLEIVSKFIQNLILLKYIVITLINYWHNIELFIANGIPTKTYTQSLLYRETNQFETKSTR